MKARIRATMTSYCQLARGNSQKTKRLRAPMRLQCIRGSRRAGSPVGDLNEGEDQGDNDVVLPTGSRELPKDQTAQSTHAPSVYQRLAQSRLARGGSK